MAVGGKISLLSSFLQQMNSVRPTPVQFLLRLSRVGMITKWSLQFRLMKVETNKIFRWISKEKNNAHGRFEEFNCLFCYPLVNKFMTCLSKKKQIFIIIKKNILVPSTGHGMGRPPASNENPGHCHQKESKGSDSKLNWGGFSVVVSNTSKMCFLFLRTLKLHW